MIVPHIYGFLLPLFVGNTAHMLIVKFDLFPYLAVPISTRCFGKGKTIRGFIFLTILTSFAAGLLFKGKAAENVLGSGYFLGAILGFTYALGELPNSYIKRRIGIQSGEYARKMRWLQVLADKLDSLLLLAVVYYFLVDITVIDLVALICLSFILHLSISYLYYKLDIKKSY